MVEELSSATCKADSNTLPTKLNVRSDRGDDDIDESEEFKDKQEDIDFFDRLWARSDGSLGHWETGGDEIVIVRKVRRNPAALAPLRLYFAPIASSNRADNESDRRPMVGLRLGTMIVSLIFQADMF